MKSFIQTHKDKLILTILFLGILTAIAGGYYAQIVNQ